MITSFKKITLAIMLLSMVGVASAVTPSASSPDGLTPASAGTRIGLGQETAQDPPKIKNLRLSDPLVQQKYLNEPDMLRFLRGTYAEACTRGMVSQAAKQIKADKKEYSEETRKVADVILTSNRVWKLGSFEMEVLMGASYLNAANYCDCMMKEITDQDLVNPRKGMEVIEKLPESTRSSCINMAKDKTGKQMSERKAREPK